MLTKDEYGTTLKLFKIFSKLGFYSFDVNLQSGKITRKSSKLQKAVWGFYFAVSTLALCYMHVRFLQSLLFPKHFVLHHFPIHFVLCLGFATTCYITYSDFVRWPEVTLGVFNQLFEHHSDQQHLVRESVREFSWMELTALYIPFVILPNVFLPLVLFLYDPSVNLSQ